MKGCVALVAALALPAVMAISPVSVKGSKMYTDDGKQWYMKGVAYQLTDDDPLANPSQCALDAALMKTLGVNSIRSYHVDPTADHDKCMQTFADAGIYSWIDLDTYSTAIIQAGGPPMPTWNRAQYNNYSAVMDAFAKYDNVAGFFVGNEVMNSPETSIAAPFVKAAARDMKAYRDNKGYRKFPIGYTAADVASLRPMLQNYLACGSDASETIDVFGLNAYEWCGERDFMTSGYSGLQKNASEYNIPIFFSETGCNQPEPRGFGELPSVLGPDMDGTWSGAIIYEWIQEANSYGLISYGPPAATGVNVVAGFTRAGTPTPVQPDFGNLSKQFATLTPAGTSSNAYSPSLSAPPCPAFTSGAWSVSPDAVLPTLGQAYNGAPSGSTTTTTTTHASSSGMTSAQSGAGSSQATITSVSAPMSVTAAQESGAATSAAASASKTNAAHAVVPGIAGAAFALVPFVALF